MTHLVGIGGIGMSAIARLLLARGEKVTGSDVKGTPLIQKLRNEGAFINIGHRAENVKGATRMVVSSAIDKTNPEYLRAAELGIPVTTRGQMLAELTNGKKTIAVAGTHGKTTTTAMIAKVLTYGGLDPTVAIGGEPIDSGMNARFGKGEWFVTESDESDGSFLYLNPTVAVVTNIENDHIRFESEWQAMLGTFKRFVAKAPSDGLLVAGVDNQYADEIARSQNTVPLIAYGINAWQADLHATVETYEDFGTRTTISLRGTTLGTLRLRVPGEINVQNALAAIAIGMHLGMSFQAVADALDEFQGVRRRFEFLLREKDLSVVDDYAHHPTAVRETIKTARRYHKGPLIVAFEPHRYSRTRYLARDFADALAGADHVILAPIYAASEPPIDGVSSRSIGEPLAARGTDVTYVKDVKALPEALKITAPAGSLVLMLGAGAITESAQKFAAR
ncbi:MAG: UDP-N-acetylmuramate--L-alanine ligase [Vulcanimicrobiaceae bacterium]